jgi:hypothetical protein
MLAGFGGGSGSGGGAGYASERWSPGGDTARREDPAILRIPADALSQLELMLESVYHMAAETAVGVVELGRTLKNKQVCCSC